MFLSSGKKNIQGITRDFIYIISLKTHFHFLFVFSDAATIIQIVTQLRLSKKLRVCPTPKMTGLVCSKTLSANKQLNKCSGFSEPVPYQIWITLI